MDTESRINIEKLCQAISEEQAQGHDVREDSNTQALYYDLKELRQQLQQQQQQLLLDPEQSESIPNWQPVISQAETLLTEHSKDLEIACWLVEALVQQYGFSGIISGLNLLSELISKYSDKLYPQDDEDENYQLLPIAILNGTNNPGTLTTALNLIPLFNADDTDISTWDIHQAMKQNSQDNSQEEALTLENIATLAKTLTQNEFEQQQNILQQTEQAIENLDAILNEKYAEKSPSLRQLKDVIKNSQKFFNKVNEHRLQNETAVDDDSAKDGNIAITNSNNREAAINALTSALTYYQSAEPHSPIIYLLQRAIRWSDTDLVDIFDELITHDEVKFDFARVLGMPMPDSN